MSAYDRLATVIHGMVDERARQASPPVSRGEVVKSDPLAIDIGDTVIEEGDEDVLIDRGLLTVRPDVGDTVRVHYDGDEWIVAGVLDG